MKSDKKHLEAYQELWESEKNIEKASFIKRLFDMQQAGILTQTEFEFGKSFLLTYDKNRTLRDYDDTFMNAILILRKALQDKIVNEKFYQKAVKDTLSMKRDKFLAQLLNAQVITMSDYNNADKSQRIDFIRSNNLVGFGRSTPPRIAIMLSEKCGFRATEVVLNSFKQKIVMRKANSNSQLTICAGNSFFGSAKVYIKDENNNKYTYTELLKKIESVYGAI